MATKKQKPATKKPATKKPAEQPTLTAIRKSVRLRVFELLAKHADGLTMPQIKDKLGLKKTVALVKHECLADNPRMKREQTEEARAMVYSPTARGKKAIEADTVDSEAAPSSAGYTDKE